MTGHETIETTRIEIPGIGIASVGQELWHFHGHCKNKEPRVVEDENKGGDQRKKQTMKQTQRFCVDLLFDFMSFRKDDAGDDADDDVVLSAAETATFGFQVVTGTLVSTVFFCPCVDEETRCTDGDAVPNI